MAIVAIVIAAFLAPLVVVALLASAGPAWLLWTALVFALLLLYVTAAEEWWRARPPPLGWVLVPLALLLVPMGVVAIGRRGAAHWVLWPIVLAAVAFLVVRLTEPRRPGAVRRGVGRG